MRNDDIAASHAVGEIAATLEDALSLLAEFQHTSSDLNAVRNPETLLDQCLALCAQHEALEPEPVRTVHHFACTGGTLISKCIAAMPNTQVLSEVDPLSTLKQRSKPVFSPTDMITLMRQSTRGVSTETIIDLFIKSLETIYDNSVGSGLRLVLRDHAHSHYCTGNTIQDRPAFREIVASRFSVLSILTVRHPLDSFLSLRSNNWINFSPPTLDEYCRRYLAFSDEHNLVPLVRYEDFVQAPKATMQAVCSMLHLPYQNQFTKLFHVFALTGDSGRSASFIEAKSRRPVPDEVAEAAANSSHYKNLTARLLYD